MHKTKNNFCLLYFYFFKFFIYCILFLILLFIYLILFFAIFIYLLQLNIYHFMKFSTRQWHSWPDSWDSPHCISSTRQCGSWEVASESQSGFPADSRLFWVPAEICDRTLRSLRLLVHRLQLADLCEP